MIMHTTKHQDTRERIGHGSGEDGSREGRPARQNAAQVGGGRVKTRDHPLQTDLPCSANTSAHSG